MTPLHHTARRLRPGQCVDLLIRPSASLQLGIGVSLTGRARVQLRSAPEVRAAGYPLDATPDAQLSLGPVLATDGELLAQLRTAAAGHVRGAPTPLDGGSAYLVRVRCEDTAPIEARLQLALGARREVA